MIDRDYEEIMYDDEFLLASSKTLFYFKKIIEGINSNEVILNLFKDGTLSDILKEAINSKREPRKFISAYFSKLQVYAANAILFYQDDTGEMINSNIQKKTIKWEQFLFAVYELRDDPKCMKTFKTILSYSDNGQEKYKLLNY